MAGETQMIFHSLLEELTQSAKRKCYYNSSLEMPSSQDDLLYCNRTFDKFGCWDHTPAGQTAVIRCLAYLPYLSANGRHVLVYKQCMENGTWAPNPVGNSSCVSRSELFEEKDYDVYVFLAGYTLSILLLSVALFIFMRFRQLRCDRITIHKNLFLSYILNGIIWIIYFSTAVMDGGVLLSNPVWCRVIHVFAQYFVVCNFSWMFCEGLYLHAIMVRTFKSGKGILRLCLVTGWVIPGVLTIVYAGFRSADPNGARRCWIHKNSLQWIMFGPIFASILVNILFLVNILRVLLTKLRNSPDAHQTRAAVRATLILIPLLGLQHLLFPIIPSEGSTLVKFYDIFSATITSLQGSFVAVVYCFCNGEVITVLRRKLKQRRQMGGLFRKRRTSTFITMYTDPTTGMTSQREPVSLRKAPTDVTEGAISTISPD